MDLSRRALLAGAVATLALSGCAGRAPQPELSGTFRSTARLNKEVGWQVITPDGHPAKGLPVVVFLHGKNGDHTTLDYWANYLSKYVADGGTPMAIAGADGGNGYYHRRASGEDAGAMITDEFVPLLAKRGLDTGRLALAGVSMGGYGSLRLAGLLGADRVRAVAVASPALWREDSSYAPGAFDSARDHREHNVFGRQQQLAGMPVRVDCGLSDPFLVASRQYVAGFPAGARLEHSFTVGGHSVDYWLTLLPAQLALLGRALS